MNLVWVAKKKGAHNRCAFGICFFWIYFPIWTMDKRVWCCEMSHVATSTPGCAICSTWIQQGKKSRVIHDSWTSEFLLKPWKNEFPWRKWKPLQKVMKFRMSVEILNTWISVKEMTSYYEFPNFRWQPENINMNFRQGNESATEIHEFPNFRWHPENMNFRQGNESTTEIHEFPSRKWNSWISEFPLTCWKMNFRQGNESTTEIHEFANFR